MRKMLAVLLFALGLALTGWRVGIAQNTQGSQSDQEFTQTLAKYTQSAQRANDAATSCTESLSKRQASCDGDADCLARLGDCESLNEAANAANKRISDLEARHALQAQTPAITPQGSPRGIVDDAQSGTIASLQSQIAKLYTENKTIVGDLLACSRACPSDVGSDQQGCLNRCSDIWQPKLDAKQRQTTDAVNRLSALRQNR